MSLVPTALLIILIFGVLLVIGVSWVIRRGGKQKTSRPERPQATRQTPERAAPASPATRTRLSGPFADVERQVEALRRQATDGQLTEEECKARMRDLMVEDNAGNWWMVGYETGQWYRHDGTDWVQADPPGRAIPPAESPPVPQAVAPAEPKPRRFWGVVVFVAGLAVSIIIGWSVAALIFETLYGSDADYDAANQIGFACWGVIGLGGLILSVMIARKVWRGK